MTLDHVDGAVECWYRAIAKFARAQPHGIFERRDHDIRYIIVGKISIVNGIFSAAREANADAVAAAAQVAATAGVPWSIIVREANPSAAVVGIAEAHGLKTRTLLPFMLKTLEAPVTVADDRKLATVRAVSPTESKVYIETLAAGFDDPEAVEIYEPFGSPAILATPSFTGYLAEADGVPVATGFAAQEGDWVCIYSITTLPGYRRQGYGRAVMNRLLIDAHQTGARHALLHSSAAGFELYRGLGFQVAENWTVLN
jgi:N-acetylglutamate synthase